MLMFKYHRTYLPTNALHTAREYTFLPSFIPSQHSLFKIHTHIASQEFIFSNFAPSPTPGIPFSIQFDSDFDLTPTPTLSNPQYQNFNYKLEIDEYELFDKYGGVYDHNRNPPPPEQITTGRPSATASTNTTTAPLHHCVTPPPFPKLQFERLLPTTRDRRIAAFPSRK
jgi:hypothetical protein